MFGYVVVNPQALSKEERARYKRHYCGLCHQLDLTYGSTGRNTLSYDMTFLHILLSSLYELEEVEDYLRCVRHPLKRQPFVETSVTSYVADMNLFLSYYQYMDDWHDDRNFLARKNCRILEKYIPTIVERYPAQCKTIKEKLKCLREMEKANELNPDLPANCFGELMGTLFVWREGEYSDTIWRLGAALGRFIYLLDAVNDLKADILKQRYNPLVSQIYTDFTPMLTIMMAECTAEFEKLPLTRDRHILQNILYSGVWQKYRVRKKKGAKE